MLKDLFNPKTVVSDCVAGLTLGIESVPDAMASGLLAAVNPIYCVYAYMIGTPTGAVFASSAFMAVQATSAMSLIVADVPQVHVPETGEASLFALAILTGIVMLILGLLKLGSMLRFVPKSVMTGFVNGIATLIILGQLGDLTGYDTQGANKIAQTRDLLQNLDMIDLATLMVGVATILLIVVLERTRLKSFGIVVGIVVASLLVPLFDWESVALVSDIAEIPGSLPRLTLPSLSLLPALLIPAVSLALVGLVQGAGVSQNYVNPDGNFSDASGDFVGQGAANVAAGLFQGMPVGGSLSATALVVGSGAKSKFANIFAGITMAVVLLVFGDAISRLAMPALAGLLIIIGVRTLKIPEVELVWKTGTVQRTVMVITFAFTLLVPLQYAVLIGVALAILLFVMNQSNKIVVKEWKSRVGQLPVEQIAPEVVPSNQVTVLVPYGSLFFAAVQTFEEELPDVVEDTHNAVIILNLRGRREMGSTFLSVVDRYAQDLQAHNSKLMLAEVSQISKDVVEKTGQIEIYGRENIFQQTEVFGESIVEARHAAEKWLAEREDEETEPKQLGTGPDEVAVEENS